MPSSLRCLPPIDDSPKLLNTPGVTISEDLQYVQFDSTAKQPLEQEYVST